jgi:hypothetical protein
MQMRRYRARIFARLGYSEERIAELLGGDGGYFGGLLGKFTKQNAYNTYIGVLEQARHWMGLSEESFYDDLFRYSCADRPKAFADLWDRLRAKAIADGDTTRANALTESKRNGIIAELKKPKYSQVNAIWMHPDYVAVL